ncbi:hypothetical protein T484DRAFT_1852892 [Baffinella frigidus]|nr:hypothetical protein T484DRAFT_1852892 [Cryptophyta sp. CCMP2293]
MSGSDTENLAGGNEKREENRHRWRWLNGDANGALEHLSSPGALSQIQRAQVLEAVGRKREAAEQFLAAAEHSPRGDKALALRGQTLAFSALVRAWARMRRGGGAGSERAWGDATEVCDARRVVSGGNDFFWTHLMLSRCEDGRGRVDAAVAAAGEAVRLKPDYALAYNEMGMRFGYWQGRGEGGKAVELLKVAVGLEPSSGIYRVNLAIAHQHQGETSESVVQAREAARLLPSEPDVHQQLGRTLEESGRDYMAGRALEESGDLPGALDAYHRAVQVSRGAKAGGVEAISTPPGEEGGVEGISEDEGVHLMRDVKMAQASRGAVEGRVEGILEDEGVHLDAFCAMQVSK